MKHFYADEYPNEVFTVEHNGENFQTVFPAELADSGYGDVFSTEQEAYAALFEDAKGIGVTLRTVKSLQGICKDCGNGTLNNETNPAFESRLDGDGEFEYLVCNKCGSQHLDLL